MLIPGTLLQNRYRIHRQIGGGGMGVVYLAEDTRLPGRHCAIKEMSPAQLAPQDRTWAIPAFRQEAQMLAKLSHPGLTAVTDFFPEGGNWYLVMDYVEGKTLRDRLERARRGRLPPDEALGIVRQLCDVLEYLHGQSPPVVFRDLKPGNVMLTPQGEVKLIDFGIARFFKPGQTRDTVNLGTPGYAAPELYGGLGQSDPRTDVYSLGVLLHQMVTGHDPTTAATPFPLPPPGDLVKGLPAHVEEVISRATRMQPDLRFQSVGELRQALFPPTWVLPQPARPAPQPYTPPQPRAPSAPGLGKGIWIGLGIAVVLIGLCAAVLGGALALPGIFGDTPMVGPTTVPPPTTAAPTSALPTTTSTGALPTMTAKPTSPSPSQPLPGPTSTVETIADVSLRIVYVYGNVGSTDIYVANADGSGRICVACQTCDEAEPVWSPDGRYIVYQADCGGSYDIWIVSSSGGNPTQLTRTSGTDEREPDWSPDGSQIAFRASPVDSDRNADGDLRVMNADGSNAYSLDIQGRSPVWSPDGRRITFMSERSGSWEVYVYDFQSGATNRLTNCSANCRWPDWSPDGQYVVYHSTTGPGSVTADTIWYLPASGGNSIPLVSGHHAGRPSWSVSGLIAFNSDYGIEVVREDGSGRQILISGDQNWAPVWSE
nr:serine/threonine-protein kinase [Anaerolineae bacterium]